MTVTSLERLWAYLFFVGAFAMLVAMVRTAIRGWARDEDGVVHYRDDGPYAFMFMQALQLGSVALLVALGFMALNEWK
ncbi:hypothetical protein OK349_00360 [Sphingomonas sp. BT-65]|uniref:hypothetical protein n=1 Tax=Sphingomonas sp. BT-65 TaxID=2989821 RepID=UPI0022362C05|nr:hypothetical protein [Sphingomonas sp. BT-65]MCW4460145.1 hypothetical protein [Sphingomonas sp. BT-65]